MEAIDPGERRHWREYCSIIQSPLGQFLDVQNTLLSEQLSQLAAGQWTSIFPSKRPFKSIQEFRRVAPLHEWRDYLDVLRPETYNTGGEEVQCWVQTSWCHGTWKQVPWTRRFFDAQCRHTIAALMMSVARREGEVRLNKDFRVLPLLPGTPFASAWLGQAVTQRGVVNSYLEEQNDDSATMPQRMQAGIQRSLRTGVDCVVGMASTLLMARREFQRMTANTHFPSFAASFGIPSAVRRELLKLSGFRNSHPLEPGSLLSPKSVITWGADTTFLTPALEAQWGGRVLQLYASSEAGILAMQDWRRRGLIFLPTSAFLEFRPEDAEPEAGSLLLLDQLEEGGCYEPVLTSFYGMPFLRLRQGDLLRVVRHNEHGVPEFEFVSRADDVIDIGSIARIDRPTLAEALASVGVENGQWEAKKEYLDGRPMLCLYVADHAGREGELQRRVHHALGKIDPHYREAAFTLRYPPLRVVTLPAPPVLNGVAVPEMVSAAL
ncbi:MAG: GH3 auxin-responsive promoter family protein [Chloroflexi bacterium]|nr:GH3 auxin-responsive promoter family protein [Chloroflexota bacterium]